MDNDHERLVGKVAAALHSRTISRATAEKMIAHILLHVDGGLKRKPAVMRALRGETTDCQQELRRREMLHADIRFGVGLIVAVVAFVLLMEFP